MKVIDTLLNIIEMYINEIKKKKILLNEETIKTISKIFFYIGFDGSTAGSKKEKNKFKNYFDENNRLNVLHNLFKYLISQTLSPIQKETINWISIAICFLFKNEIPLYCDCVLKYVKNLKPSPLPIFDYGPPLISTTKKLWREVLNDLWNQMIKADECLWNGCPFNEMIVGEDFEIENGMLGLERDIYLSIVKFLDSLILRKV
jgi:hypothetical protein